MNSLLVVCCVVIAVAACIAARSVVTLKSRGEARPITRPAVVERGRVVYYRTKDGKADYGFSIERQPDGSYRSYIVSQPSYGNRDTTPGVIHRLIDGDRYYVCWNGRLNSEKEARQVAALWADCTQEYIRTGRRF